MQFVNIIDPKAALDAATYNHSKAWKALAQPIDWFDPEDYVKVAAVAQPKLQQELIQFCQKNKLAHAVIPHSDFRSRYEIGTLDFKEWFSQACARHGQNRHADVMIVTRVKELERATEKNQFDPTNADRVKDYLGGMMVFLNGNTPKSRRDSLNRMATGMQAMESDERTLAINNHYWQPLEETHFRGYKSAWQITPPEDSGWEEFPILASLKIEHESQMGIDRQTRKFMGVKRTTTNLMTHFWDVCQGISDKNTGQNMSRTEKKAVLLTDLGGYLYDHVFANSGMNRFINPQLLEKYAPIEMTLLRDIIRTATTHFGSGITDGIFAPDILPSYGRAKAAMGEHLRLVKKD